MAVWRSLAEHFAKIPEETVFQALQLTPFGFPVHLKVGLLGTVISRSSSIIGFEALGGLLPVKSFRTSLYIGAALACAAGFIFPNQHPHFWWQKIPVFDAVFGFIGCILIIFFAKWIGHQWLTRNEDYYD